MGADSEDVLVQEILRARRGRRPLLIAASLGIIGLGVLGIAVCFAALAR